MVNTSPWHAALRRYLLVIAGLNLVWESAHLPLYTIWREEPPLKIAVAVLHCTAGDVAIAATALFCGLALLGRQDWPERAGIPVAMFVLVTCVVYTVFSERLNLARGSWAYSQLMPMLPWWGVGVSPVIQSIVVPSVALMWASAAPGSRER